MTLKELAGKYAIEMAKAYQNVNLKLLIEDKDIKQITKWFETGLIEQAGLYTFVLPISLISSTTFCAELLAREGIFPESCSMLRIFSADAASAFALTRCNQTNSSFSSFV